MKKGLKIAGCIVLGILLVGLFGWITMSLWNWLVPSLFSGPVITFWQALGLLLLSKILFSGFGKGGGGCGKGGHRGGPWKNRMEKFSNMTPEEREAFKRKMKDRWCRVEPGPESEKNDDLNS